MHVGWINDVEKLLKKKTFTSSTQALIVSETKIIFTWFNPPIFQGFNPGSLETYIIL